MKTLSGEAFIFGDDIDTDEIIDTKFLRCSDLEELKLHCMEDIDPEFAGKVKQGDIIVADKNFGTGSGRLQAALALKALGVSCVIAKSFGRIFYRNAINIGLPLLECPEAFDAVNQGDHLDVFLNKGSIVNRNKGETYHFETVPALLMKVLRSGGLIEAIEKQKLK